MLVYVEKSCTFFGLVKEFSSMSTEEVIRMTDDLSISILFANIPEIERSKFKALLPKFTACNQICTQPPT